ncbi:methylaspartate mutase subunit E [Desulforamulus putei]|uniref:Glutamate mutase epsilon subunit n=1 Tax=Desulforamulus putei DSM 12395 TaxID=1121429 RepID=A0A1M4U0F2_9FIRM|nr:methylaspartate mutase subunit E [Desulforamulus putei]SHE50242.1 Glutamate mutase subunit E [Desulforamulus putei DSM 12395]
MQLSNKKLDWDQFLQIRQEVLNSWPTGQEVDLEEAVAYQSRIPAYRRFAEKLEQAKKEGITLAQPRAGVALVHEHIELLRYLQDEGGADLLPTTIDSYTRQNRYQEAQSGIEESRSVGRSMLNGFPAVNHGVAACREVVESVKVPVQVRHGTPDARLLTEITLAGGFTAYEGGGISYNIPYAKDVPLERSIRDWQYVDRLVGYYEERGISINREPFGPLTGTLVPPCISHSVAIIEALLAAEQGVKSLTLGYGQCGNLTQDVAAVRSLEELAEEYLGRFGYHDVVITTVFHQWMGGFPQDESKAFGVISWGAATAAMAKATKVIVKTPHEAMGIPTKEANAAGIRATKQVLNMLKDQPLVEFKELQSEKELIKAETRAILEKLLEFGDGDIALGTVRGFQAGIIDVPFAPSRYNAGRLLPARDYQGAVRLLDFGNLPFGEEIKEVHREKIKQRGKAEGRDPSFQMVIDDIYAIGKGMLVGKPR